ncbi:MAG: LamG domain-containing protein, partial [Pirellulaceae bacterium]
MFGRVSLGVILLVVVVVPVPAEAGDWWHADWRYRTTVTRPEPWRDVMSRVVEVAIDFPLLLERGGVEGAFDSGSLRVINPRTRESIPFARRPEFEAGQQKRRMYLSWFAEPEVGEVGRYDIYFDTRDRQLGDTQQASGTLPPANLIDNGRFAEEKNGVPASWNVTPETLVSLDEFARTTGGQSLKVAVDDQTPEDVDREVTLSQRIDVREFAGQAMLFECDLLAQQAKFGCPVSIELQQFRKDGSRIREYAVQPRWLSLELAEGQLVQFSERGRFSHEAAEVDVRIHVKLSARDADTGDTVTGPDSHFTVWLDRFVVRPGERWPWPAPTHAGFTDGALEIAPINRAFEFTGRRRLCFNGASEGTLTAGTYGDHKSVHWGLQAGTLEFWCKPSWTADDGVERVLFHSKAYGHRLQSRLRKRADGQLQWTIADSHEQLHSVTGPATLRRGAWHHLAATWSFPKARLQLFIDGKRIARSESETGPWPFSLVAKAEGKKGMGIMGEDRRSMPMQAFIGGDSQWTEQGSAEAVVDEFRVSSRVRYDENFAPSRTEFEIDDHTRALFHFENERHGEHHSDDRFVRGHLACEPPPQREHAVLELRDAGKVIPRRILVKPHGTKEQFEKNRAKARMRVYRPHQELPDPRLVETRERSVTRIVTDTDDAFSIQVNGDYDPWMRCVTFELAEGCEANETLLPRWRANDNVVPFSVEDLSATLAPEASTEKEKTLAVFSYALDTTNYYDAHFCETLPGGRHRPRVSYTLLKALNIYPMDQCGPMNHMLRKLFLTAGISSTNASGTHHQFEQAFYDGNMRLCDLSSRQYWLARDNETVISRRGMEEDPYLKLRQGGTANAWLRGRKSRATFGRAVRPHSMDFPLRRGERVSICWHNEGRWFEMTGDREPIPLAKIPPFFGNGEVLFEPVAESKALVVDNLATDPSDNGKTTVRARDPSQPASLVYKPRCPYIFSDCQVTGRFAADEEHAVRLLLSFDKGKNWTSIWSSENKSGTISVNPRRETTARYAYWMKLELASGTNAKVSGLRVRNTFVASPWSLPGQLKQGKNRMTFAGGPVRAPVKTTCSWIERHRTPLGVSLNSLSFYLNSDQMHRNVFMVAPGQKLPVQVVLDDCISATTSDRVSNSAVSLGSIPAGWNTRETGQSDASGTAFVLEPKQIQEGDIASFDVLVAHGQRKQRVPVHVLVADAPLVREAEGAATISGDAEPVNLAEASGGRIVRFTGDGELAFSADSSREGTYAIWLRARW